MLSEQQFMAFVSAASLASSADNMQPWEFRKRGEAIEVYCAKQRMLPTDVMGMFTWVSIGAAIQNLVVAAAGQGLVSKVEYTAPDQINQLAAIMHFFPGNPDGHLADWISVRATNRSPYQAEPVSPSLISNLTHSIQGLKAGLHWTTSASYLNQMALMDANSSYIRLEHKPLHDELFGILRFTQDEIERTRYGLDFKSLGVPVVGVWMVRQLKQWLIYRTISRLGVGRIIANQLSSRLRQAGGLCLVTAQQPSPVGYLEAGRAMEQLWLAATAEGLSIQPYGVLPQYLTKAKFEPETFLPRYVEIIQSLHQPFFSIFPGAKNEYPAIVLRAGFADQQSSRSSIRLNPEQIIKR